MALVRSTKYAPDIYQALNGILLIHKPPAISTAELVYELRHRISDSLNEYQPRPLSKQLLIEGDIDEEKRIVERPNLSDHPLVVGPRYTPWELRLGHFKPSLSMRASGLCVFLLNSANQRFYRKMRTTRLVNVYELSGKFGFITDTFCSDGLIKDKRSYKHIKSGKMDAVLSRIESVQQNRLFDSASVPIQSQAAYELAKAWPSRPPRMAEWPVIYRLRCIHLRLPHFKLEVTVTNETENFLVELVHDVGILLRSGAFTESIRRIKFGPFDVCDSLTDKDWTLPAIMKHLDLYRSRYDEIDDILMKHRHAMAIRTQASPKFGDKSIRQQGT